MNKFMARLTQVSFWGPETLRGNGASARAKHQQATAEKVSAVTTERINMLKTLKRKIALGAVAAVGAAGLVTIAAPVANAAPIASFTAASQPQRAVTGSSATTIKILITTAGTETGTIRAVFTAVPTAATADSVTAIAVGDTMTATAVDWSLQTTAQTFTAGKSDGTGAKNFNTAGTYSARMWFDRSSGGTVGVLDADEPYLNTSFAIGGTPTAASITTAALTVAGTATKTFSVTLKDAAGNATLLGGSDPAERINVLASIAATSAETFTVGVTNATPRAAVTANGTGGAGTPSVATFVAALDTVTASTGAYSITGALSGSAVGTISVNLGGSTLNPMAAPVTGTLTATAAAFATSIAIANTAGVTAANTATAKPGVGPVVHTGLKYFAPEVMDTGFATAYDVAANAISASTVSFTLTGTAGSIVNVVLANVTGTNVTAATTPITLDASGKATYTVTPTTASGAFSVKTSMKNAAGAFVDTGYTVTYTAAAVTAAVLGLNGITTTPDITTVTSMIVKTGTTNTFKVNVKDQYGVAKQYYAVTGTLSAGSRNATATITQQFTDANGDATLTLTDASTSTTVLSDVLQIGVTAPGTATPLVTVNGTSGVVTITYSSTGAYAALALTGGTTATATVSRAVMNLDAETSTSSVTLTPALTNSAGSAVTGVALVFTGSAGVFFRAVAGTPTTGGDKATITVASNTPVAAYGTKPGTATVTVAGGGLTQTATFTVTANTTTNRNIALTAAGNKFTAVVTDGYGNPIPGITVSLATTSQGIFGGGVTSTSAVTDSTGSATAVVSSADGKAGAVTVSATMSGGQSASLADSPVTGLTAGNASATATGAVVASAAVSGDAATAAAQKATDAKIADIATAVTNLSTTVAGLVASLVAQIKDTKAAITATQTALTALAAVVNKIKAKVKA